MKKCLSIILAVSVILSSFVCIVPAFAYANPASDTEFGITYLWNDDFSSVESLANYTTGSASGSAIYNPETGTVYSSTTATYSLTDEGTLKIANTGNAYNYIWTPYIYNNAGGQLVLSYDIKFDKTGQYYQGGGNNGQGTDHVFVNYDNKIYAYSSTGNVSSKLYTKNTWMNVTVIYNDTNTGTTAAPAYCKDIYINGEYYCTLDNKTADTSNYTYRGAGSRVIFSFGNYRGNSSMELDNLKVYALPTELKYKVKSISPASAVLEFNAIPTEYAADDFEILNTDGTSAATVSSATISETNPREVIINFASTLSAGTDYIIKPSGVKAGTASGDICTELSVPQNDAGITVTTGRLDNSVYSDVLGLFDQNFENVDSEYTTTTGKLTGGEIYVADAGAALSVETIDGNKSLRITQGAVAPRVGFILGNANIPDDPTGETDFVFEYRVRADFSANDDAMFDARPGGVYGVILPSIYNGGIYNDQVLTKKLAGYTNNEWVTLTNVFKFNSDKSKVLRDTYIDGVYASTYETAYDANAYKFLYGTGNFNFSFRVRDVYSKGDTDGVVDIDYIRAYRIPVSHAFGAEIVSDKSDCDVNSITVKFNNFIDTNSLTNAKVTLKDGSDIVANVLYADPVAEANATGYALKAKLVFDKVLDFNTEYDLYLDDVADISSNKLIFKDTLTTSSNKITSFAITNSDTTYTANIEMTASDKDLTLVIAAYTVTDDVEKMEGITTTVIQAGSTTGEVSLANVPEGAEVRAYLLNGFKPIACAE